MLAAQDKANAPAVSESQSAGMSSPTECTSTTSPAMTIDGGGSVPVTNAINKRLVETTTLSTAAAENTGVVFPNNPQTIDENDTSLNEKRRKRLEKNRLSARECRRRKKEATEQMQHEINLLEGENLRLRLQLQVRFKSGIAALR